jgi:hypothetical protein
MNKNFIFSVILLGLSLGKVECSEQAIRNNLSGMANTTTNVVIISWAVYCVAQRKLCGKPSDYLCTALPVLMLHPENKRGLEGLAALLAGVNIARIGYGFIKRPNNRVSSTGISTQTETVVIAGPCHKNDKRAYMVNVTLQQFDPSKK